MKAKQAIQLSPDLEDRFSDIPITKECYLRVGNKMSETPEEIHKAFQCQCQWLHDIFDLIHEGDSPFGYYGGNKGEIERAIRNYLKLKAAVEAKPPDPAEEAKRYREMLLQSLVGSLQETRLIIEQLEKRLERLGLEE